MKKLFTILCIMIALSFLSTNVYAGRGADANIGGSNGGSAGVIVGGPNHDRTGWIYYLVDKETKKQVSKTAAYVCNSYGITYPKSTKIIKNPILRLKSRFGVEPNMNELAINPSWGKPYTEGSGHRAISRNEKVKKHLLQKIDIKANGVSIGKRERAFNIIMEAFGFESAIDWYNQKTMLVYEPFYWHSVFKNRTPTKDFICATSYRLGEYQKGIEGSLSGGEYGDYQIASFTNNVHANCIKLERVRSTKKNKDKFLGLYIPTNLKIHNGSIKGLIKNADMATKEYGFGICMVWNNKKPTGIINTYDGSNSPGNPEETSKKKHTKGKSTIIKQYWEERTDQNGEIEYVNIGNETNTDYYREKTVKNIIITDEENLPTGNPQRYKLVGWFTGKDLDRSTDDANEANPTPGKELTARLKKAREKFRGKTNKEIITLGEDKSTKKKYKDENSLVVVFLRKKATDGIVDTYNHKDSPGDPEDPSNDKTKQGKKKILKQYWDEIEVYKNGIKTETKYKHIGTYKEDNVVKHVKVTEEPKEYKIIGWFTGRDKKVEKNPKPRTDVATEVSYGIQHGNSSNPKVTLGKDEQIITVIYLRTKRKDLTLQKDETGDYKISESKISIRDGFDSKNRLNRILSNTFVWESPAIANTRCFDHGGNGHHFFCTKYEHTHTEGPCYHYYTTTRYYREKDENGKWVEKSEEVERISRHCSLYEHTHSNDCWDTPCGGWD